jgi:hypothetical protein
LTGSAPVLAQVVLTSPIVERRDDVAPVLARLATMKDGTVVFVVAIKHARYISCDDDIGVRRRVRGVTERH